jgi:hypothetical protein
VSVFECHIAALRADELASQRANHLIYNIKKPAQIARANAIGSAARSLHDKNQLLLIFVKARERDLAYWMMAERLLSKAIGRNRPRG